MHDATDFDPERPYIEQAKRGEKHAARFEEAMKGVLARLRTDAASVLFDHEWHEQHCAIVKAFADCRDMATFGQQVFEIIRKDVEQLAELEAEKLEG